MTDNYIINTNKPNISWNISKKIYIKDNILDKDICDSIIQFGSDNVTKGVNKYSHLFEISFHSCLLPLNHDVHDKLQETWKEIINHLDIDVSFIEPYELKRYTTEDFFGKHIDNYYSLTLNLDRKITMSVQLSDDSEYEDGAFNVLGVKHKLKKGSVIAFPSFFPHEVEKITSGSRWSLIGWAWGPYWK